jgi:endonuclease III
MKNSKDYSSKIDALLKTFKKEAEPVEPVMHKDPISAIVYAFVSAFTTEANAAAVFERIQRHFVDVNDLRVSRPEEILEVFGEMSEPAAASAQALTQVLNAIFEKYDKVALDELTDEGKRQAHKDLQEIAGMTPFAVSYTFLTALDGHAIPLTDAMVDYLIEHELVHPESTRHEIESFLERQIHAHAAYFFYACLRSQTEGGLQKKTAARNAAPKKKAPTAKKAKKKTPKK